MVDQRQWKIWGLLATAVAGSWAIVGAGYLAPRGPAANGVHPLRILIIVAIVTVAMAWALAFLIFAFRRLDEYQRQASQFSWYWGTTIGLVASAPIYAFIAMGGLHWLWPDSFHLGPDLLRAFVIGYGLPLVMQVAGALGVRTWWSLRRR